MDSHGRADPCGSVGSRDHSSSACPRCARSNSRSKIALVDGAEPRHQRCRGSARVFARRPRTCRLRAPPTASAHGGSSAPALLGSERASRRPTPLHQPVRAGPSADSLPSRRSTSARLSAVSLERQRPGSATRIIHRHAFWLADDCHSLLSLGPCAPASWSSDGKCAARTAMPGLASRESLEFEPLKGMQGAPGLSGCFLRSCRVRSGRTTLELGSKGLAPREQLPLSYLARRASRLSRPSAHGVQYAASAIASAVAPGSVAHAFAKP